MKMNYLIFAIAFALLSEGCSDKKEETQEQQTTINVNLKKAKNPKIPLDSSQILRYKDIDQSDSIMVGIRVFDVAKKEFVKRWNYAKDTELFMDVVGKICREAKICASRLDSVAYKKDVAVILDSLMRNNILDSVIDARKKEKKEWENSCHAQAVPTKECHEKLNKEMKEKVMKELKRRERK